MSGDRHKMARKIQEFSLRSFWVVLLMQKHTLAPMQVGNSAPPLGDRGFQPPTCTAGWEAARSSVYSRERGVHMMRSLSRRSLLFRSAATFAAVQTAGLMRLWGADPKSKPGVQMYMVAADYRKDPA